MYPLHMEQSTPDAISEISPTRVMHLDWCGGGRLQTGDRHPTQAGGHALDRKGRKHYHRPALQQAQRTLRGFLGTPFRSNEGGSITSSPKFGVRPVAALAACAYLLMNGAFGLFTI